MVVFLVAALALSACGPHEPSPPEAAQVNFARVSSDPIAHGERLSVVLGCSGCHGENLDGKDWSDPEFVIMWTSNLSRAMPTYSDAQLKKTITGGVRPDGSLLWDMPSHLFTKLAAEDMRALTQFLRSKPATGSLHARPQFKPAARKEMAAGLYKSSAAHVAEQGNQWPPDMGSEHALGRYIARATCAECHQMDLRGGVPYPGAPPRPDLRVAGSYDSGAFQRLMRTGIAAGDREVGLMSGVARSRYSKFTDAEIAAVHGYLVAVARQNP